MSKLAQARKRAANLRERVRERESSIIRKGSMAATSYGLGKMEAEGTFFGVDLPTVVTGWPKATTLALLGLGGSIFAKGRFADALEGLGDGGLSVMSYRLGLGEGIQGGDVLDDELADLEAELDELVDNAA